MILFTLGGLFAIYEGIEKLRHPHGLPSTAVAVGILLVAIVFESYALRKAVRHANAERSEQSRWRFLRRSKTPEIPIVLLEDAGAQIGLFVALAGVALAQLTGNHRWDAAGSLTIGVLLVVIAIFLAIEMKSLLIGESASLVDQATIRSTIEASPHVRRFIHLRTQHLGPEELLVGAKVQLDGDVPFAQVTAAINTIEHRLREAVPEARVIYMEPDVATNAEPSRA